MRSCAALNMHPMAARQLRINVANPFNCLHANLRASGAQPQCAPCIMENTCAAGAAAAFILFDCRGVGIGASGAVFGLYVLSVGVRLCNFSWRKLVEVLAITPFVLGQIAHNVSAQVRALRRVCVQCIWELQTD